MMSVYFIESKHNEATPLWYLAVLRTLYSFSRVSFLATNSTRTGGGRTSHELSKPRGVDEKDVVLFLGKSRTMGVVFFSWYLISFLVDIVYLDVRIYVYIFI